MKGSLDLVITKVVEAADGAGWRGSLQARGLGASS